MTIFLRSFFTGALILFFSAQLYAQTPLDPNDPFDFGFSGFGNEEESLEDKDKSAEQLLEEAQYLFMDERPLDARSKLLIALQKDPKNYETHRFLAGYYMIHVGHYRLALKYIKKAMELFEAQNGKAPYAEIRERAQHAQLLYFLAQIRLNLDNYQGSLDVLDDYASFDYYEDWYPGTKAWTLMKLGRVEEAIQVARQGIMRDAEPGRTLNILGILLSITNERELSLSVFRKALEYELSLGSEGQPATPLNNSGEVLREIFREEEAERSWQRATSLPDGCEHILPFFNLMVVSLERGDTAAGKEAIDAFESCIAQFPLRNGEEHRAFVQLARGRIALQAGYLPEAIEHFEEALDRRQWFGKIGTSEDDLRLAASASLALTLEFEANRLESLVSESLWESLDKKFEALQLRLRAWWLKRRAKELFVEEMNDAEDLYVRHSDSMIDYANFGNFLSSFPLGAFAKRIAKEKEQDDRSMADLYYNAYLAESSHRHGKSADALKRLQQILSEARPKYDTALIYHLLGLRLQLLDQQGNSYRKTAEKLFSINRAALRNFGQKLPVTLLGEVPEELQDALFSGPFLNSSSAESSDITLRAISTKGLKGLELQSRSGSVENISVEGETPAQVVNKLAEILFRSDVLSIPNS